MPSRKGENVPLEDTDPVDDDVLDGSDGSDNLRQVREAGKRQKARAEAADAKNKELEEKLLALELKDRQGIAAAAAKEKGLTDAQFEALKALNPDPSVEAIEAFAVAFVTDQVPGENDDQPDIAPATDVKAAAPPKPVSGSNLKGGSKDFSTEDFVRAARSGNDAELRQMAELVTRDPSRLSLKHGDLIPD